MSTGEGKAIPRRTRPGGIGSDAGCRSLAAASGVQLTAGVLGMVVAVRRGLPYDVRVVGMSGRPDTVLRDSIFFGTALSAPVTMLIVQALATRVVASGRGGPWAIPALGVLGAAMVGGYLGETLVRRRLRPSGWELVESSVAIAGTVLAGLMAILSARCLTRTAHFVGDAWRSRAGPRAVAKWLKDRGHD